MGIAAYRRPAQQQPQQEYQLPAHETVRSQYQLAADAAEFHSPTDEIAWNHQAAAAAAELQLPTPAAVASACRLPIHETVLNQCRSAAAAATSAASSDLTSPRGRDFPVRSAANPVGTNFMQSRSSVPAYAQLVALPGRRSLEAFPVMIAAASPSCNSFQRNSIDRARASSSVPPARGLSFSSNAGPDVGSTSAIPACVRTVSPERPSLARRSMSPQRPSLQPRPSLLSSAVGNAAAPAESPLLREALNDLGQPLKMQAVTSIPFQEYSSFAAQKALAAVYGANDSRDAVVTSPRADLVSIVSPRRGYSKEEEAFVVTTISPDSHSESPVRVRRTSSARRDSSGQRFSSSVPGQVCR